MKQTIGMSLILTGALLTGGGASASRAWRDRGRTTDEGEGNHDAAV